MGVELWQRMTQADWIIFITLLVITVSSWTALLAFVAGREKGDPRGDTFGFVFAGFVLSIVFTIVTTVMFGLLFSALAQG